VDIYIVRHAIAEQRRPGVPDEERNLTEDGRKRFARVVAGLGRIGVELDRVFHSPWKRAEQTAEMLEPVLNGTLVPTDWLAMPPGPELLEEINGECVALVGHEPWMSELLEILIAGDGARVSVAFKKGGVAWLRGSARPGGAELRAFIPPKVFKQLV
jgi:phosphohistidine phosphatase